MDELAFAGCWEVVSCTFSVHTNYKRGGLQGREFILHNDGRVTWYIPKDNIIKKFPLLECTVYKIYYTKYHKRIIRFMGPGEECIEFMLETASPENDLTMISKELGLLYCTRFAKNYQSENYNFLVASDEGLFSDVVIASQTHKKFHLHSVLLSLLGKNIPWNSQPPPFNGLPDDVLKTIIHWLYAEYLPKTINEDVAEQVIEAVKDYKCMSKLVERCQIFIDKVNLKKQIIHSISTIHSCINEMIIYFKNSGEELRCDPAKLCLVLKQSIRDIAVVILKFVILCDLFEKNMKNTYLINSMSVSEKHDIVRYTYQCLPEIISKLRSLLQSIKTTLTPLTPNQKWEIATYFVPEIEAGLETISNLVFEIINAFEQKLHLREFINLQNFHRKISNTLWDLLEQKKCFGEMTENNKIRSILRNLDQIIDELPVLLLRLEDMVDDEIQWKEFKICFDVVTKKMSEILSKLTEHKEEFQDVLEKICILVQRQSFTLGLINLGLLDIMNDMIEYSDINSECQIKEQHSNEAGNSEVTDCFGYEIDLVKFLMLPPTSNNDLSKAAYHLLMSKRDTDLIFEIPIQTPTDTNSKINRLSKELNDSAKINDAIAGYSSTSQDYSQLPNVEFFEKSEKNGSIYIKAHRVIVAARCIWFKRALQSGMKEAINNHIVIHDTTPDMFRELLHYIYTGNKYPIVTGQERITELMLLADRYELDGLKLDCEIILSTKNLNKPNICSYINLADQYNAQFLKRSCIEFISRNPDINFEQFENLSSTLKSEINERKTFYKFYNWNDDGDNLTLTDLSNLFTRHSDINYDSNLSSSEEISIDTVRMNQCLLLLRNVVGPFASLEELNRIILAADYDVNRAINFYYSIPENHHRTT